MADEIVTFREAESGGMMGTRDGGGGGGGRRGGGKGAKPLNGEKEGVKT